MKNQESTISILVLTNSQKFSIRRRQLIQWWIMDLDLSLKTEAMIQ